jgi:hypothetical protein
MDLFESSNIIAGGIEVVGGTLKCGGQERVVGENAKWNMRNKFLRLKHLSKSSIADEKSLLKIVSLKISLTFNKQLNFYNDDKKPMPVTSEEKNNTVIHGKAIEVLNIRLNETVKDMIERLTSEYNLRAPLVWVLSDIVKFLAIIRTKKKPTAGKIKISPQMAELIEKIWRGDSYFKYVINSDDIPSNMLDLMLYMLEVVEKTKPPMGKWKEPQLETFAYPVIAHSKIDIEEKIDEEKITLKKKIKGKKGTDVINEYIFTILNIEKLLIDHIDDVEQYYINLARNMSKILDGLKMFFKK